MSFLKHKLNTLQQTTLAIVVISIVTVLCYFTQGFLTYKAVALLLLMTVSVMALLFNISTVIIAATISALVWNFFFIPPHFTFAIQNPEDIMMFGMYFLIALVHAVLTYKIRQYEDQEQKRLEKEKAISLYNTIINSLSHELRTPIATIIAATDHLQEQAHALSFSDQKALCHEISTASFRLNEQVENLLNMSRLESGTIQLKPDWCDVNELVYSVIEKIKPLAPNHVFLIKIEENLPLCKIDTGLIYQVIYNLIHNAIQYSGEKKTITVSAFIEQKNLIMIIEDNGVGFPADEIKFVFNKFYRIKNTAPGGTGLGLSIVKGFTEAHSGDVELTNIKTGGARFRIRIPTEISILNTTQHE